MKAMLIHFDITPGKQADFEAAATQHVHNIRERDPSYSLYNLTRQRDCDTRYVSMQLFESWETQLAHQTYDYVLEMMPAMSACLSGPPTVEWLEVVA